MKRHSLCQSEASLRQMARAHAAGATWLGVSVQSARSGKPFAVLGSRATTSQATGTRWRAVSLEQPARAATTPACVPAISVGWVYDRLLELLGDAPQGRPRCRRNWRAELAWPTGMPSSLWQGWSSYEEAICTLRQRPCRVLGDCLLALTALSPDRGHRVPAELADSDREALLTSRLLSSSPAERLALRMELQEVSARRHRAEMAWSDTLFARPLSPRVITLDSLRRSLPSSGALLELKLLRGRLLAILVTRDVLSLHETPTLSAGAGDELFTGHVRELVGEQVLSRLHQARLRAGETAGLPHDTEGLLTPQEPASSSPELVWLLGSR